MLISLFFAAGIFRKKIKGTKTTITLILFSVSGAVFLTLREYVFLWIPDFVPAVLIFTIYAIVICRAKWWAAISWSLVNYLFIGIIVISVNYILRMCLGSPVEVEEVAGTIWLFSRILMRIGQLLLSEIILLWILLGKESDLNEEILYSNSLICLLVLAINLSFLLFDEILAREKRVEEDLKTQNQLIALQMRSQDEVNNMYQNVLSLKHDINNHLHTISGYIQVGEYAKAQEYARKIAGEVSKIKSFHSGNAVVDALIGSKTALAEMNGIKVDVDLTVMIGKVTLPHFILHSRSALKVMPGPAPAFL